jgi:hypothetical protein
MMAAITALANPKDSQAKLLASWLVVLVIFKSQKLVIQFESWVTLLTCYALVRSVSQPDVRVDACAKRRNVACFNCENDVRVIERNFCPALSFGQAL